MHESEAQRTMNTLALDQFNGGPLNAGNTIDWRPKAWRFPKKKAKQYKMPYAERAFSCPFVVVLGPLID